MPGDPFYWSKPWRALRARTLRDNPVCQSPACRLPSSHVDHIQTRRQAPKRELDPTNVMAFCASCHNAKTARHDGGYGNARKAPVERDADGWPVWHAAKR